MVPLVVGGGDILRCLAVHYTQLEKKTAVKNDALSSKQLQSGYIFLLDE